MAKVYWPRIQLLYARLTVGKDIDKTNLFKRYLVLGVILVAIPIVAVARITYVEIMYPRDVALIELCSSSEIGISSMVVLDKVNNTTEVESYRLDRKNGLLYLRSKRKQNIWICEMKFNYDELESKKFWLARY